MVGMPMEFESKLFVNCLGGCSIHQLEKPIYTMTDLHKFRSRMNTKVSLVLSPNETIFKGSLFYGKPKEGRIFHKNSIKFEYLAREQYNGTIDYAILGLIYKGKILKGRESGFGELFGTMPDGKKFKVYAGDFENGCPHGKGKFYSEQGFKFSGIFD